MRITTGGWEVDILVHGYPGRSTVHGGLGWSTIALLRGHGRVVLLDGGGHGQRGVLMAGLKERGLTPLDVTDLLLSHAHHDHCVNWPLFRQARIWIGRVELGWALGVPWGETPVPEHVVEALSRWPTLRLMEDGEEVMPGITAHLAPGHTPGHLIFVVGGDPNDVILLQDAVKNRAELISRDTDMTYELTPVAEGTELRLTVVPRYRGIARLVMRFMRASTQRRLQANLDRLAHIVRAGGA